MSAAIAVDETAPVLISPNVTAYVNRKYEREPANSAAPIHASPPTPLRGFGGTGWLCTGRYYRQSMKPSGQPGVVITGIGVVSPFGVGRERFWQHIGAGCSGIRRITEFDVADYPCQVA